MRKVLLVEDEKLIRKGIRAIIEDSDTVFKDILECPDGKSALKYLCEDKPDLVITDIRMPYMDGISFIKEAQGLEQVPKFIILSGYDDFDYAREAVRYGVKAYLLKPIDQNELVGLLHEIETELYREENASYNNKVINSIINGFYEHELHLLLTDNRLSVQEARNITQTAGLSIFDNVFFMGIFVKRCKGKEQEAWNADIRFKVLAERYFKEIEGHAVVFKNAKDSHVLIIGRETDYMGLLKHLADSTGDFFTLGLSSQGKGLMDISKTYAEACEAVKYRIIRPAACNIIRYQEIANLNKEYNIRDDLIKSLTQMLGTNRITEIERILGRIFEPQLLYSFDIGYVLKTVDSIWVFVVEYCDENILQKSGFIREQYECLKNIYNFNDIHEYIHTLKNYMLEINSYLISLRNVLNGKSEINAAVAYIRENYHKDLSLSVVANHVSMNYTYFSTLFSEKTGMCFASFLNSVRIEKAKELIKNTNLRMNEIGEKVGYRDPKHFLKTFKKFEGITPVEFKNKPLK